GILVHQLYSKSNNSYQQDQSETEILWAVNKIRQELSEAAQIAQLGNEIRFRQGYFFKSLYYDDGKLTLYDLDPDPEVSYLNPSLNLVSGPEFYKNPQILTEHLRAFPTVSLLTQSESSTVISM